MAVDFHLKLEDIKGESKVKGCEDQIQLLSFSWGSSVSGTGGSGAGRADLSDLSIMKHMDIATSPIFKALVAGKHLKTGVLVASKAGGDGKPFLKLTFDELFVTSQQISASSEIPTESVSFSYSKIKEEYFKQDVDGTLKATAAITYDLQKNTVT